MAPVDSSPQRHIGSNFELVCSLKGDNNIPVHKYKSHRTGLTVLIAEVDGPIVNGYFCLATEALDDDGLPHTLEHLVFLGSENYPYKGVLDLLANRCLASGTNAWTDVDHTCYTMTTAGSEGFLSLLPIYLEHILYPTLTDDGYITEVHHITGEGEDAGVVYCEMQGRENSGESRVHLAMNRAIYPGECGYKSETGGIMKNLRESTSNAKVRQYHKDFYRPENLTVIITGAIKPVEVFRALEKLEEQIVSKGPRGNYKRPWQNPVPPFEKSLEELIEYPCDDEDNGIVNVAWRGPSPRKDIYTLNACALLFKYLTDTAVSPLQKEFVEIDDPFASSVIYSISENSESVLYLTFMNVPTQKVDQVQPKLKKYLELFAEGTERIDMKRMKTVVHRQKLERISLLENSPHESVAYVVIADVLHGNNVEDLNQRLNYIEHLNRLETEPEEFWLSLLKVYLIDNPEVTIKGIPSIKEQTKMTADEKARVAKQRETLGEDGLKKKAEELRVAMENNEKLPPNEMLTSVPIPSTDSITFHKLVSYTSDSKEKPTNFDIDKMPVYTYLSHVNTNFVYMFVVMDTETLTTEQRNYLPLLFEAFTETSIKRGDKIVPYEDIVAELEADTVAASSRIGLESSSRFTCGPYSTSASLLLQVESDKYERGILWLKELLYDTVFTPERLKIIALKMSNDIPHFKRKGNKIAHDLMKGICYNKNCNVSACNLLRQQKFLTSIIAKLNGNEAAAVIDELNTIREIITSPKGLALFLAANLNNLSKKYPDPASLWKNFLSSETPFRNKLKVKPDYELMVPFASPESNKSCIIGLGCVESSFFVQATPSIRDFNNPDLAALMLFMQYLSQLEGPMWRQIRGGGFAYHYNIYTRPNEGLLYLIFFKATNPVGAYKEARKIIESQLNNGEWDPILIESARSSLIFEIIDREKSVGDVVSQSLLSYFKGVDHEYNRKLVSQIGKVSVEDLNRVGRKYVSPLFEPEKTRTTIVCHPSKTGEIAAALKELIGTLTNKAAPLTQVESWSILVVLFDQPSNTASLEYLTIIVTAEAAKIVSGRYWTRLAVCEA